MAKEDAYKETKICKCISCGVDVTVTKFASAAKVLCDKCKGTVQIVQTTPSAPKPMESNSKYGGSDTKILPCITCGKDVTVTKFASAAKVQCPECKGEGSGSYSEYKESVNTNLKINMKKLDRAVIPPLEEYVATPALVANPALREVECPACGHKHLKILKTIDWSSFGLIIHYQCHACKLIVSISEQATHLIRTYEDGDMYDYSGSSIESLTESAIESTRKNTTIQRLMKILKDNNINVDGEELPPYLWDNKRPVPVGYVIPETDINIKTIDEAIKRLFDVDVVLSNKLKMVFKGVIQ